MPLVEGTITDDSGTPLKNAQIDFELVSSDRTTPVYASGGGVAVTSAKVRTDDEGAFSISLPSNADLIPVGTYYIVTAGMKQLAISVPDGAGPYDIDDILVDEPGEVEAAPLSAHLQDETAHAAEHITFEPTGPLQSTNAQDAIVEAASEAAAGNHNHDATYVNESDHTLGQHTGLGLAPQSALTAEALARAEADLTEADLREDADDAEAAARTAADALLIPLTQKGAANGVAPLVDGLLPTAHLPALSITDVFTVNSQAAMLALAAQRGDVAVRSDLPGSFILAADDPTILANWTQLPTPTDSVISVNGQQGVVVLGAADVGADPAGTAAAQVAAIPNDGAAGTPSRRTLGAGPTQAAAGNHNHDATYGRLGSPNTWTDTQTHQRTIGGVSRAFRAENFSGAADAETIAVSVWGRVSVGDATPQEKLLVDYIGVGHAAVVDGVPFADTAFWATTNATRSVFWQQGNKPTHFMTNGLLRATIGGDGDFTLGQSLRFGVFGGAADVRLWRSGARVLVLGGEGGSQELHLWSTNNNAAIRVTRNNQLAGFIGAIGQARVGLYDGGGNARVEANDNGLGFYGTAPIAKPAAVADAAGGVVFDIEARVAINALLARIRSLGLIAV